MIILATAKMNECENTKSVKLSHGYIFDKEKIELLYNDSIVKLSKKEKEMLLILISANNAIVSSDVLEQRLYYEDSDSFSVNSNGALRGLIHRFRGKLEYNILESIHSYGFRIRRIN